MQYAQWHINTGKMQLLQIHFDFEYTSQIIWHGADATKRAGLDWVVREKFSIRE